MSNIRIVDTLTTNYISYVMCTYVYDTCAPNLKPWPQRFIRILQSNRNPKKISTWPSCNFTFYKNTARIELPIYFQRTAIPHIVQPSLSALKGPWTEIPNYTLFRHTVTNCSEQTVLMYWGLSVFQNTKNNVDSVAQPSRVREPVNELNLRRSQFCHKQWKNWRYRFIPQVRCDTSNCFPLLASNL